jgi:capsular polysaccharide transport system permease protein
MTAGIEGVSGGSRADWADRLADHVTVILALARREMHSRFGQNAVGYAWTYVVPLLWIGGTYVVFTFVGRRSPVYTDLITFIISGLIPFLSFRLAIGSMGRINGAVRRLVIFPGVTRDHAAVAMGLVELANTFVVFGIVAILNLVIFGNGELDQPLKYAAGVILAWGLGIAFGYLLSTLALINVTLQLVGLQLMRPAIFLSGIFFVANELPSELLAIFSKNPIMHAVEFARDGMLFHYQSRVADPSYVLLWIAAMFGAAFLVRVLRRI